MFSAIYFFNLRGDILIQRIYRDDIECATATLYICRHNASRPPFQIAGSPSMRDGDMT
jgi:hypothetical protein